MNVFFTFNFELGIALVIAPFAFFGLEYKPYWRHGLSNIFVGMFALLLHKLIHK